MLPCPPRAAVTAPGFAWQRPGPAELPAHRRPDRQDRGLWALALQVQSKAGLGGWGLRAGTPWRSCGHTHPEPCAPRHTSPSPAVQGHPPALLGQQGGCSPTDHPARGSLHPRTRQPPPAWSPWVGSPTLSTKRGFIPPKRPGPLPSRVRCSRGGSLLLPGCAPLPGPVPAGSCQHVSLGADCLSVCLSCLQLLQG